VIEAVLKQIILNVVRPFSTAYAVYAANHATLQFGMALQHGVQGQQILPDQRPGTVALVPVSSRSQELPDRNDKKARFWVTLGVCPRNRVKTQNVVQAPD